MSIPSNVAWATRSMSGMGGGILSCLEAGRYKIISFVLSVLIVSLFLAEHAQILSYSRKKTLPLFQNGRTTRSCHSHTSLLQNLLCTATEILRSS